MRTGMSLQRLDCFWLCVWQIQERRKHIFSVWAYSTECDEVEHLTLTLLTAIRSLYSSIHGLPSDAVSSILRKIDELVREYGVRARVAAVAVVGASTFPPLSPRLVRLLCPGD